MKWLKVSIAADRCAEDILSEMLLEVGAQGVSIEGDEAACTADVQPWDYLDEKVLKYIPYSVCAYYVCDGTEQAVLQRIREKLARIAGMKLGIPLGTLKVNTTLIDEKDWANAWKAYFKPVKISDTVVIKPTWEEYPAKNDEIVIELDPGMAFGTGNHETTQLCVCLMEEYIDEEMYLIDVGCGSGILSIAAAKLGARRVEAVDFDRVAVDVTKNNVILNGVDEIVTVRQSDLLEGIFSEPRADIIVANIIADVVLQLAEGVSSYLKMNGMLICSGIINTRLAEVQAALASQKFRIIKIIADGEWRALACKYKG